MAQKVNKHPELETEISELRQALSKISEQLRASRALSQQLESDRAQLAAIVDGSRDAIWSWNSDGTIALWNAEAQRLFGYSRDEIIGQSLLVLVPADRLEVARKVIENLEHGAWYGQFETIRLRKDRAPIDVELTVSPIKNSEGRVVGASTVCRDITERKQAQASLAKRVGELTALYQLTEQLQLGSSFDDIHQAAIDAIVNALGCSRASILLFDETGVMRFVASRGLSEPYRKAVDGHSPWTANTKEPQPIFVEDIRLSGESEELKATIAAENIVALAFIPLVANGKLIGKFMTYYPHAHVFAEDEKRLANTIARQLALAVSRRQTEDDLRKSEEHFRLMSENAPVMIWMSDAQGHCLHLNRMLRTFWGVTEGDIASFDWSRTIHPEDASDIGEKMMAAVANRASITLKGRYTNALGRYRILQTNARPRFAGTGEFLGMIGVNVDITDSEEAEKTLRESEEQFRMAVEAAPSGMIMTDSAGRIVLINAQSEKLFGYHRNELVGQPVEVLLPEPFRPNHPELRLNYHQQPTVRPIGVGRDLFARRKDGTEVPVEISLSPIETKDGLMALASVVDISERKKAEAHRELLVAELNHRVKNTLAVVQSIANQTFNSERNPKEKEAFQGRLMALAKAHDVLTQSSWESAALDKLVASTLQASEGYEQRVSLAGPHVLLSPREALALTMALHELFTNAIKYGALSNGSGQVDVTWTQSGSVSPQLNLTWRERGGPPVERPKRKGFGSVVIERALAQELEGEVTTEFMPDGLRCNIAARLKMAGVSSLPAS